MKFEYAHKNRLSNDMQIDTEATNRLFKIFCVKSENDYLIGYIQEHSHDPFGFLTFSQLQVK